MHLPGVDDCLDQIPNRFELCAVAVKRARQIVRGANSLLPLLDHKATVHSLAEIASGQVDRSILDDPDLPLAERAARIFEPADSLGDLIDLSHAGEKGP